MDKQSQTSLPRPSDVLRLMMDRLLQDKEEGMLPNLVELEIAGMGWRFISNLNDWQNFLAKHVHLNMVSESSSLHSFMMRNWMHLKTILGMSNGQQPVKYSTQNSISLCSITKYIRSCGRDRGPGLINHSRSSSWQLFIILSRRA